MKNRNALFVILGIIVLVALAIGIFYHFRGKFLLESCFFVHNKDKQESYKD